MMAVKVLNSNGSGQFSWILKGVEYMLANGAIVSNHSYGGSTVDSARKTTYNNLANNNPNHAFVYASGNSNQEVNTNKSKFWMCFENAQPNLRCSFNFIRQ